MPSSNGPNNRIQGVQFEKILEKHCNQQGVLFIKLPIGAKPIGRGRWIRQTSPFDYVLLHEGSAVFLDCKSLDSKTISYSTLTEHQITSLSAIREHGSLSGYMVWFRPINQVVFFEVKTLLGLKPRQSLSPQDGIYLGRFENIALGTLFYFVIGIGEEHGRDNRTS